MIDTIKFINIYKQHNKTNSNTILGLNNILFNINHDTYLLKNISFVAYILATIYHETNREMYPSRELRQVSTNTPRRKEVKRLQDRYWDSGFYGRGYCHITWMNNYQDMSHVLKSSLPDKYSAENDNFLVTSPNKALDLDIAYDIIVQGMIRGVFNGKGKGLAHYLDKTPPDYVGARYTVNIQDQARQIADYAKTFESWLSKCKV